jgi:hypothetical protein
VTEGEHKNVELLI